MATPAKMTDADLRKIVQKDSDDRLRNELTVAYPNVLDTKIAALTREELVGTVTRLRSNLGQTVSVKDVYSTATELPIIPTVPVGAPVAPGHIQNPSVALLLKPQVPLRGLWIC